MANGFPAWQDILKAILARGEEKGITGWCTGIERWYQAEVFGALWETRAKTGWEPRDSEAPFVTLCPINIPTKTGYSKKGTVEYAHLLLERKTAAGTDWLWVGLNVGYPGEKNSGVFSKPIGWQPYCRDMTALLGFNVDLTAAKWSNPDKKMCDEWLRETFTSRSEAIRTGKHFFAALYLQIGGPLSTVYFNENAIAEEAMRWFLKRVPDGEGRLRISDIRADIAHAPLINDNWLVVSSWHIG